MVVFHAKDCLLPSTRYLLWLWPCSGRDPEIPRVGLESSDFDRSSGRIQMSTNAPEPVCQQASAIDSASSSFESDTMSRLAESLCALPPSTLLAIVVCTLLFLVQLFTEFPPTLSITFCPRLVLYNGQVYRIVTSALYHIGPIHLLLNMLSTAAIGSVLEKRLGTLRLMYTSCLSMLVSAILYLAAALFLGAVLKQDGLMNQHSVGFSGVLFHWLVLECNLTTDTTRRMFGVIPVPTRYYPWAM